MKAKDSLGQAPVSAALAGRVDALVLRSRVVNTWTPPPADHQVHTPGVMLAVVRAVKEHTVNALRLVAPESDRIAELHALAMTATDLEFELYDEHERRRSQSVLAVETVFERLRHIDRPAELLARACVEVLTCTEFSRVMLSRVEGAAWVPWVIHTQHGEPRQIDDVRIPLAECALENDVSTSLRASFMADTRNGAGAAPELLALLETRSYAVAALAPTGSVIGLLHADYHPSPRAVDCIDRDLLGILADDISRAYERAFFVDGLRTRRVKIRDLIRDVESSMGRGPSPEQQLSIPYGSSSGDPLGREGDDSAPALSGPRASVDTDDLTQREQQILALVVQGLSNRAIAEQLVVVEGTVKSHVKHLLRKFGVVNRSELIAHALQTEALP